MHLTRLCPSLGIIKNILIIILVALEVAIFIIFNNKCGQLQKINNELESTINNQESSIQDLEIKNNNLSNKVLQLEEENSKLIEEKNQLIEDNAELEEEISSIKTVGQTNYKDFKSYMSYTAITNRASKQWDLQQQATTNENGFRCIDGKPLVAVGTGWGLSVGDYVKVYCANGNSFEVIIGDIKADEHTMADNKTTASNHCRCEFIVDTNKLNQTVKKRGNVSILKEYSGYVIDIK